MRRGFTGGVELLALLVAACASSTSGRSSTSTANMPTPTPPAFNAQLTVDPDYIYDELAQLTAKYQAREAGYAGNAGHDGFAHAWAAEMQRDLAGFGPVARDDTFTQVGWYGRPSTAPGDNVEVSIPGATHPEQVVVIGCHYDGEANSTQSAFDDASGCAIELGVARMMATYWRAMHLVPARTLRFIAFDAEEQGLYGSYHYLNATINGDVGNIVAMFNEEQNGIAYPLRFLGALANPLLPFFVETSYPSGNPIFDQDYGISPVLTTTQMHRITQVNQEASAALPATFQRMRQTGHGQLAYRDTQGHQVTQSVFTPQDQQHVTIEQDTVVGSDHLAFEQAGLPIIMFAGDSTYYTEQPAQWAYPYDQPQDTLQLMNIYAGGSEREAPALTLALALPALYTAEMLTQPDILGGVAPDGKPLAAIGDIGTTLAGQQLTLTASGYDAAGDALTFTWDFGDGNLARGSQVTHAYAHPGTFTLTLTAASASGTRTVHKRITVTTSPTTYTDLYANLKPRGTNPSNPQVPLPTPVQGA